MGEAKRRGTFEQRKAEAVEKREAQLQAERDFRPRRASPKHLQFMSVLGAIAAASDCARGFQPEKPILMIDEDMNEKKEDRDG